MKSFKKNTGNIRIIFINICYVLILVLAVMPLLLIAKYNYPSADDWSFGADPYKAIREGAGIGKVMTLTFETVKVNYINWEGRFSATFFASLQPGIWGEKYYRIVTWLMIGMLIASAFFLCQSLIGCWDKTVNGRKYVLPVMAPVLVLQILYCPYPEESLYWYTGSVNYTFVYGLSLILLGIVFSLGLKSYRRWQYLLLAVCGCFLAVLVGGNNFATSLSCVLALIVLEILFFFFDKRAFFRTFYFALIMGICLIICIWAPGSQKRLNGNFDGRVTDSAIGAIWTSLVRSFTNIYSWTNLKVVFMILLIAPFTWYMVKEIRFSFRFPVFFTIITFGLYASQATATVYVDGTMGGGRMGAILFYSYYLWVVGNMCYWTGWIQRHREKWPEVMEKIFAQIGVVLGKHLILWCAVIGILLVGTIYLSDLHNTTSYKAYRNLRQGFAQQYALEWEKRLEVLHNENIKQVEFKPLSLQPEMLIYTDLQDENGYLWVNSACANYYGKEYVRIVKNE